MRFNASIYHGWVLLIACVLVLGLGGPGMTSSFRSNSLGARARGMGGAFVAVADDTSAGFWNPAGLAFAPDHLTQFELKFDYITAEYTPPGGSTEQNHPHIMLIPAAGSIIPLHKNGFTSLELLGYVPDGFQNEWNADAPYRFNVVSDKIRVFSLGGATAYKANNRLAVGAAVFSNGGKVVLENKVPSTVYAGVPGLPDATFHASGNDTSPNYHLGILWLANKTLRVGATYRSPIDLTISGDAELAIPSGPTISDQWELPLELPQSMSLGVAWQATPVTLVAVQADWVDWSSIDRQVVTFHHGNLPNIITARNWRNRTQLRVGVENTSLLKPVVLRFGYSYDPTPVPSSTLDPLLLDVTRCIVSTGIGVSRKDWTLDLSYEHMFGQRRTITNSIHPFPTNGTYDGTVDVLVLTLSHRM